MNFKQEHKSIDEAMQVRMEQAALRAAEAHLHMFRLQLAQFRLQLAQFPNELCRVRVVWGAFTGQARLVVADQPLQHYLPSPNEFFDALCDIEGVLREGDDWSHFLDGEVL